VETYSWAGNNQTTTISSKNGICNLDALRQELDDSVSGVIVQQPNFYGQIEDLTSIAELVHSKGAKLIVNCNPLALALLKSPGECGADIAVGDAQMFGMPLSYGGPYLGFLTTSNALVRKVPGRIVGLTHDSASRRVFVLTLQAREQHIRREKAGSNVCSNQALCAMTACVYLASQGPQGLKETATACHSKAVYLANILSDIGLKLRYPGAFFHEFVTDCNNSTKILDALDRKGILGGLPLENGILWCTTELNTRAELDLTAAICREVLGK
jgi:glycine dehydrogenase subunit 1